MEIARVPARVGLLGNPSDAYGGRVLAFTVEQFAAEVLARPSQRWVVVGADGRRHDLDRGQAIASALVAGELGEGAELLAATVALVLDRWPDARPHELWFETTIPRQVGLAGSSAVVLGALRVLGRVVGHEWRPLDLARAALAVEVERLGVAAGPQDRIVQAMGGLLDMRFVDPWDPAAHERLDPACLPPCYVAWRLTPGASSGVVHGDVRSRWQAGDATVTGAMERFAQLAGAGRSALDLGDPSTVADLLDESFRLRDEVFDVDSTDRELVELGRRHGAGVSFCGSGGAVVGVLRSGKALDELVSAHTAAGFGSCVPVVGPTRA